MAATLYIIQGFIGAGKTTFSKDLALKTGAPCLNADNWVKNHHTQEELSQDWDRCFANAIDALWQQATTYLASGKDVILDFGFWTKKSRDYARQIALETNAEIIHYYIDASPSVLLKRLSERSGPVAKNNIENFAELRKQFEEPSHDEIHIHIYSD